MRRPGVRWRDGEPCGRACFRLTDRQDSHRQSAPVSAVTIRPRTAFNVSASASLRRLPNCSATTLSNTALAWLNSSRPRSVRIAHDPRRSCACPSRRNNPALSSRFTNRVTPLRVRCTALASSLSRRRLAGGLMEQAQHVVRAEREGTRRRQVAADPLHQERMSGQERPPPRQPGVPGLCGHRSPLRRLREMVD